MVIYFDPEFHFWDLSKGIHCQKENQNSPYAERCVSVFVLAYVTALTNYSKPGGLNNRNVFSHSFGARKFQIFITWLESRCEQGGAAFKISRGKLIPGLFQLLVAPGIPWLVAASLQSLPLWSHGFLLFCLQSKLPLSLSQKDTSLQLGLTWIIVVVEPLGRVRLFGTPWTAARQASLSFTLARSLLKLKSIELVMPSNHLILCHLDNPE